MTLPNLPVCSFELSAPVHWRRVEFISDLHLGEDTPLAFEAWARYMADTSADAIFILGDLFEVWVGDDARLAGFEGRCAEVLASAASRASVFFMAGNRDFLVGETLLAECGVNRLPDPTVLSLGRQRLLLSHGDQLCRDDIDYQQFRQRVRSAEWQQQFLALPLQERRCRAVQMREQSRRHQMGRPDSAFDVDDRAAAEWMRAAKASILIHGHTHRPATHSLAHGLTRHVLSDWELDHPRRRRAEVLRWQNDGLSRLPLAT